MSKQGTTDRARASHITYLEGVARGLRKELQVYIIGVTFAPIYAVEEMGIGCGDRVNATFADYDEQTELMLHPEDPKGKSAGPIADRISYLTWLVRHLRQELKPYMMAILAKGLYARRHMDGMSSRSNELDAMVNRLERAYDSHTEELVIFNDKGD